MPDTESMVDNTQMVRNLITSCKRSHDYDALQNIAREAFNLIHENNQFDDNLKCAVEEFQNWLSDDYRGDPSDIMNDIEPSDGEPGTVETDADLATEIYMEQEYKMNELLQNILHTINKGESKQ